MVWKGNFRLRVNSRREVVNEKCLPLPESKSYDEWFAAMGVEVAMLKKRFMALTEEAQDTLRRQFNEAKAALNPSYREVLQEILVDMY